MGKCSVAFKAISSFCNTLLCFHWTLVKETWLPCNPSSILKTPVAEGRCDVLLLLLCILMMMMTTVMCGIYFHSISWTATLSFVNVSHHCSIIILHNCSNLFKGPDMLWSYKYVPLGLECVAIWWDSAAWQPFSNRRIQQWNKYDNCKCSVKSYT